MFKKLQNRIDRKRINLSIRPRNAVSICLGIGFLFFIKNYRNKSLASSIKEIIVSRGEEFIISLNNEEYHTCFECFDDNMRKSMTIEKLSDTFSPLIKAQGEFIGFKSDSVYQTESLGDGYIVCSLRAIYVNGDLNFTIVFNRQGKISGLNIS